MPELYGLKNCDSCRAARQWLAGHALLVEFIDIREQPPTAGTLSHWIGMLGWQALLNKRSKTWRDLPAAQRQDLDAQRAGSLLHAHPLLIKRPVLAYNGNLQVGFSAARYGEIFGVA